MNRKDKNEISQLQNFKKKNVEKKHIIEKNDQAEEEWSDDGEFLEEYDEELVDTNTSRPRKKDKVIPFIGKTKDLGQDEYLEYSNSAYKTFYRFTPEWPCLSFDFLLNDCGNFPIAKQSVEKIQDVKFPLEVFIVAGSQAEHDSENFLYLFKASNLELTQDNDNEEDLGESFEENSPIIQTEKIKLNTSTNRIRSLGNFPIVAIMNDKAQLQIHDIRSQYNTLKGESKEEGKMKKSEKTLLKQFLLPNEGFGLDFSPLRMGLLACGTNDGDLMVLEAKEFGSGFEKIREYYRAHNKSIEDVQFSPNQEYVMSTCSSDRHIKIFDLRCEDKSKGQISYKAGNCDINVLSWNTKVTTLLASGADDGAVRVWDLRYIGKSEVSGILWHQEPITSIEWNPQDDWTILVGCADDRASIWDLSVEKDDTEMLDNDLKEIPDQMLFLHQGMEDTKEARWHPVFNNVVSCTALNSFHIFKPAIDEDDEDSYEGNVSPNDLEFE